MLKKIIISFLVALAAYFFLVGKTTIGLSHPMQFSQMNWGMDKAILLYILLMFSAAHGAVVFIIMHFAPKLRRSRSF